ncbi:sporulation protein [Metabacillus litoralis]|uniref:sporulation protein n=1 Tax=Metabacillus TaxID=2675233 RepID=UPI000EF5DE48|nr:sporulation protein [Metabacillus litoralis]MCM3162967.1 sporulation protein [Metabacillus litoralis]MCM3410673.1 sporulation protein [Metabacillus litoralis]UHA58238.1 sporulation protein [Metabacillus litoralis]
MSFFNKILASVGVGSAKVDAKLSKSSITIGEKVEGVIDVQGGNVEQAVDEIYLTVNTNYEKEQDDRVINKHAVIATIKLNEPFVIMPGETKTFPFQIEMPLDTPVSVGSSQVWIQTGVDIKGAVDPQDRDVVTILPNKMMDHILNVLKELGFSLRKVKNEEASFKLRKRLPFVQEFEFIPTSGTYYGKFDEVEVMFFLIDDQKIEVVVEVDRRARGLAGLFSEALDLDESIIKFTIEENELNQVKSIFKEILENHS